MRTPIHEFPWPLGFGLIGFAIAFVVQFRLKYHIDREKILQIEHMSELYPNGIPPRKILIEQGHSFTFGYSLAEAFLSRV
jgi:hypothetical protein